MQRHVLTSDQVHESFLPTYLGFHRETVDRVIQAVQRDPVVVVGMAQNPFVKRARRALDAAGIPFTYLEFGSYFSMWKPRLAIKMWSGHPTFPQVFIHGRLVGGFTDLETLLAQGTLQQLVRQGRK